MLDILPDMVISGINNGANMGDDTIYSGTVAAATEGFLLGVPSLAVSLADISKGHYVTAARVVTDLVKRFTQHDLDMPILLNINVPDVSYSELQGIKVTRLGRRHKAEPVIKSLTPRGDTVYWVGAAGAAQDAGEGTDFHAVQYNYVSVTPLQIDLTRFDQMGLSVNGWENDFVAFRLCDELLINTKNAFKNKKQPIWWIVICEYALIRNWYDIATNAHEND